MGSISMVLISLAFLILALWGSHVLSKLFTKRSLFEKYRSKHYALVFFSLLIFSLILPSGNNNEEIATEEKSTVSGAEEIEVEETTATEPEEVQEQPAEPVEEPQEEEEPTFGIGDSVQVSDLEYVIHDVSTAQPVGSNFSEESTSDIFLILNASITNHKDEATNVEHRYFKLYQGDTEYSTSGEATIAANSGQENYFVLDQLNPGSTATGDIVFEVLPEVAEADNLEVRVENGGFASNTEMISIGQP